MDQAWLMDLENPVGFCKESFGPELESDGPLMTDTYETNSQVILSFWNPRANSTADKK